MQARPLDPFHFLPVHDRQYVPQMHQEHLQREPVVDCEIALQPVVRPSRVDNRVYVPQLKMAGVEPVRPQHDRLTLLGHDPTQNGRPLLAHRCFRSARDQGDGHKQPQRRKALIE